MENNGGTIDQPKETAQEKQTRELDTLSRIQDILKHPDKRYSAEMDVVEEIIKEKTKLALDYKDHITVTSEESPLEKFANMQAAEIKELRAGESDTIKKLQDKIKSLQDEIDVLNSFFKAYNGE